MSKLLEYCTNRVVHVKNIPIEEAKELQELLVKAGYPLPKPYNGIVGALTIKAWEQFKTDVYYADPGMISKASVERLIKAAADKELSDSFIKMTFFPQTDNKVQPDRTCNTSCCAMVANHLGKSITDDEYWVIVNKYGDTTDHTAQTKALEELGIKSVWKTTGTFKQLDKSILVDRKPCVIGILHRGDTSAPTGGHMIVVLGRDSDKNYICHDPYGSLLDGYTKNVERGRYVKYPKFELENRWTVEGDGSGWVRFFNV